MTQEEQLCKRRLLDLADRSWQRGVITFSGFLTIYEQSLFHELSHEFSYVRPVLWGGYEDAERVMTGFFPADRALPEDPAGHFPISVLSVTPLQAKFAEELTHRDVLGSLMNLGIEREQLGDIAFSDTRTIIFCHDSIAAYLCEELHRIRHTSVSVSKLEGTQISYQPRLEYLEGSVSSVRLDSLLSLAFHGSRSTFQTLVESGRVFVDGREVCQCSYQPRENALISARGYGKFRLAEQLGTTRKGRILVRIAKFI